MWKGYQLKDKENLKRIAWINAEQYNASGHWKKHVKAEDFLRTEPKTTKDGVIESTQQAQQYDPVEALKAQGLVKKADPKEWGEKPPWVLEEEGLL